MEPVGAFTARIDLAHHPDVLAADPSTAGSAVVVSTTENTPGLFTAMLREAFKHAKPYP